MAYKTGVHFINFDRIAETIIRRATVGLNQTLDYCEERAKVYVPVRAIFPRSRRGRHGFPRVRLPSTEQQRRGGFEVNIMQAYRSNAAATERLFERPDVNGRAGRSYYDKSRERRIRHANSEQPVLNIGGVRVSGNFRDVRNGKLTNIGPGTPEPNGPAPTRRGRYEIESGRANISSVRLGATEAEDVNQEQVGGALLHSIHAEYPQSVLLRGLGGLIEGHVVAGSEKVNYAGYQEFGTRHNRAHPFLRPALYDSRAKLVKNVARAIKASPLGSSRG